MKACIKCETWKPIEEFHSKSSACRACRAAYDKGRSRSGNGNHTLAARARKRRWAIANRDPQKESARRCVRTAIERGTIIPAESCEVCFSRAKRRDGARAIQAHHYLGYEAPLAIQWLCPKCHRAADAARREGGAK